MQRIYEASDIIEANILKGLLEQLGIEVYVSGFYLQGGIGEIPVSGNTGIWVADEQIETAREVVRLYETGVGSSIAGN
ncbi:MAG: putative signal transducing protein [Gammaproteobacteria bacterium]